MLKQAFTEAPILSHWVPNRQLIIETDASDYALAAILSMMTFTPLHSCLDHSLTQKSTTTLTTKNCWLYSKHSQNGIITVRRQAK